MKEEASPRCPTGAEIAILTVLWDDGPMTVPEIWDAVKDERGTGYTTILKQLQVMEKKGLVSAEKKRRPFLYSAEISEDGTQGRLLEDVVKSAFRGSLSSLVMKAISQQPPSRQELKEIRDLLDQLEKGK